MLLLLSQQTSFKTKIPQILLTGVTRQIQNKPIKKLLK